jgi:hypothetical protein
MKSRIRPAGAILLVFSVLATAATAAARRADVAGEWTMAYTTTEGVKLESTLTLKIDGDKLTGTVSSGRGSVALNEVAVKGDDITFAIVRGGFGDSIRIEYTGKVNGDSMALKMKAGAREPLDVTVKRKTKA